MIAQCFIVQPSCLGDTIGYQSNSTGDSNNSIGSGSNIATLLVVEVILLVMVATLLVVEVMLRVMVLT